MNKKWLIGCGGCLGVTLLITVIIVGLGWFGFNKFVEGSAESSKAVFGETLPEGYMPLMALPIKEDTVVLMMNSETMLFAMDSSLDNPEMAGLIKGDPEQLKEMVQQAMAAKGSNNVRSLDLKDVIELPTSHGAMKVFNFRLETKKQGFVPASLAVFPLKSHRLHLVGLMSIASASADSDYGFENEFKGLSEEFVSIVEKTDVAKGLLAPGAVPPSLDSAEDAA